jgi:hypothetical protein
VRERRSSCVPQQPQQQRFVLAAPGGGQFTQQIILPANFQNFKSLQGLKVIPMGQQGKKIPFAEAKVTEFPSQAPPIASSPLAS